MRVVINSVLCKYEGVRFKNAGFALWSNVELSPCQHLRVPDAPRSKSGRVPASFLCWLNLSWFPGSQQSPSRAELLKFPNPCFLGP